MKKLLFFLFILFAGNSYAQVHLQGIVYDSTTREILPFVNIAVKGTTHGTSSSISGSFSLEVEKLPVTLVFSYVGYEKKEFIITKSDYKNYYLRNSGINLGEALVLSGENPALKIIRKVIDEKNKNNPENNGSFSYKSYGKMIFTLDKDSSKTGPVDKEDKKMMEFFEKQHLFMSETVSEKKYQSKNRQKETILASKVSGFQTPIFSLLSSQFQSFHFYTDEVSLGDVKYVGPISKQGLNYYHFILQDTFYVGKDSVYAISFYPWNENSAQSMKGVLQIHTDGYAIYNVIAEPFKQQENGFGISISQQYQKINNTQWFPIELNTKLNMNSVKVGENNIVGIGNDKITDIVLNPTFAKGDFDELEVALDKKINETDVLEKSRLDSLTSKEKETYRVIDSLGNANHFDRKMLAMQSVFNGFIPIKFIDWDISKFINYNDYEGFRLGLALRTNHKLSKYFSLGGYIAYGFIDKALKYGGDLNLLFSKRKQIELNFSVQQDVDASSQISTFEKQRYLLSEGYSALFLNRYDSILKYEARFSFRALRHFKFNFFGNYQYRNGYKNYQYSLPLNEDISIAYNEYQLAEIGIETKICIQEKFIETPFGFLSKGSKWPTLIFRYTKGISGIYDSQFDYNRFTLKANYQINSLRFGNFNFMLVAGMVNGNSPYHLLFNPTGTYKPIKKLSIFSMDGFETMRLNEFLTDEFTSLHFRYRLPWPIVNGKKFRPYLSLANSMIYGNFKQIENHQELSYSILNKAYTESGIILDNLLKSGVSGIGIGAFYRWGNYSLPTFKENIAIKLSLTIALS